VLKLPCGLNSRLNLADIKFLSAFKQFGKWLKFKALTKRIKIHGTLLYIHSTPAAIKEYIRQPFEPYTTELFKSAIKPGIVAVDIGAQFGYYSLLAAKFAGSEVQVFAFEPAPINFEILKKNIQLNNFNHIIHPIQKATGDRSGTITLFLYKHSDSHGMFRHPRAAVKETVSAECITIDEFLGGRMVDVIKMDIEGNEPYALEGMKQTISRSDTLTLFTEFAPGFLRLAGVKPEDYLAQLKALGFDVKLIDEHSRCLRPVPEYFLADDKPFGWYANLYCTKKR
jgi:FkbM family methyltransferase